MCRETKRLYCVSPGYVIRTSIQKASKASARERRAGVGGVASSSRLIISSNMLV